MNIKKIIPLILILILLIFPTAVFADGAMYIYDRDQWGLGKENQQQVAINYQDGYQNMLISINLSDELHGEKAVWIFPVPATPEKVAIDILKGYPTFNGQDVDSKYDRDVKSVGYGMAGYSTFPIGLIGLFGLRWGSSFAASTNYANADSLSVGGLVTVHETIQEMGLTTELITAKDEDALNAYFEKKGLDLPDSSDRIFKEYIGKDYTFVVSYISDLDTFKQESGNQVVTDVHGYPVYSNAPNYYNNRTTPQVGVFVKFPTDKIYFPLKPTSVYESQEVPMLMYVIGHVNPKLYPEIKQQAEITYYTQNSYYSNNYSNTELENFFNGKTNIRNMKYTKIKLNAPSKYLVDDLWISKSAPLWVSFKSLYSSVSWLFGILIYVLLSILASLIAGLISFSDDPVPKKTLLIHGLWNCFTAVGLFVATISLKTKKIDTKIQNQLKSQGIDVVAKDDRKISYFILFYVFFLLLVAGISLLLMAI